MYVDVEKDTFIRNTLGIFLYILGGRWNIGADVGKRGDIGSNRTVHWCPALAEDWQYFLDSSSASASSARENISLIFSNMTEEWKSSAGSFSILVPPGGFVPGHISAKCHQCHGECSSMAWDPTVPLLSS